jgi:choice-of-anchor B domain-containing protein
MRVLLVAACAILATPSAARAQAFGRAVAVAGPDVLISEPDYNKRPGLVYVYRRDAEGTWAVAQRLAASDSALHDGFGTALAVTGDLLLVGATRGGGAAYVFGRAGRPARWSASARLAPPTGAAGDDFGSALALAGNLAAVAAPGRDSARGAVFLFRRAGARWDPAGTVVASDAQPGDRFGTAVALLGDRLVVGAPNREAGVGAAYVFAADGAGWRQEARLVSPQGEGTASFGAALAALDEHVLVGAPGYDRSTGAVIGFGRDLRSGEWGEMRSLRPFDAGRGARFGAAVAVAGRDLWVGAPGAGGFAGRAFRYGWDAEVGEWTSVTKVATDGLTSGDRFATSLAVGDEVAVAGVVGDDYGAGTAAILGRTPSGDWRPTATLASELITVPAITGGEVRCTDGAAAGFGCADVDVISFLPVQAIGGARGVEVNDLWGWTDPQTGREYALVGRSDGTSFIDVSDASRPVFLGDLPMTDSARGSVWRDIKVYRDHAFIVSDGAGPHGMQVFDLTQLRDVRLPPVTFRETAHYHGINSAHNIVINEATGFAFAAGASGGGETCGGGLHMVDIRDPGRPTFAGCFAHPLTGRRGTGYTHDAQCVTYQGPDAAYRGREVCFGANETALSIADVTDKVNPKPVASASYPNVAYSHQGWLTEDHRFFYMDDEGDEIQGTVAGTRTLIWDVADLDDPVVLAEYVSENRASDHNLYIRGNLMYQSNYVSGLRVLDISDPGRPVPVGHFDTVPWGDDVPGFDGSWSNYPFFQSGIVVVTSGREGVFVLRRRPPTLLP